MRHWSCGLKAWHGRGNSAKRERVKATERISSNQCQKTAKLVLNGRQKWPGSNGDYVNHVDNNGDLLVLNGRYKWPNLNGDHVNHGDNKGNLFSMVDKNGQTEMATM